MAKAGGKLGQIAVWVLLVALVIGLAGFGITGFGTSLRSLGTVGKVEIDGQDYARGLQQEMNAFSAQTGRPIGFAEAQAFGLDRGVLQRLVGLAALDNEAQRIGLSVGDAELARAIREMPAFGGVSGDFDRDAYRFTLERNNLTEAEFEARMRDELARGLLQSAAAGGIAAPTAMADIFAAYLTEARGFSLLELSAADLPAQPAPRDEAGLRAFHAENPDLFTRPETRLLRHVVLMPEALVGEVTVDDAVLQAAYDDRRDEYVQPERRLLERLVFANEEAARAALAEIEAGSASFDDLVARRGLTLADVDLGDLAAEDLGAAADAVFAADVPGLAGPAPTPLGPALFRISASFAAQEVTFDQALPDLRAELALDAARRLIADRTEAINDDLAGGATLQELAQMPGMVLAETGLTAASNEGLAAYPAFREAALALSEGDFPELVQLEDGAIAVIELVEIQPPTLEPFEAVTEAVAEAASAADLRDAIAARRDAVLAEVRAGAPLAQYGVVRVTPRIGRTGFIEDAPAALLERVFSLGEGEVAAVDGPDFTGLVQLDAILPAAADDPQRLALQSALANRLGQEMAQDLYALYAARLQNTAEIRLNQAAVDAVNAQMR